MVNNMSEVKISCLFNCLTTLDNLVLLVVYINYKKKKVKTLCQRHRCQVLNYLVEFSNICSLFFYLSRKKRMF